MRIKFICTQEKTNLYILFFFGVKETKMWRARAQTHFIASLTVVLLIFRYNFEILFSCFKMRLPPTTHTHTNHLNTPKQIHTNWCTILTVKFRIECIWIIFWLWFQHFFFISFLFIERYSGELRFRFQFKWWQWYLDGIGINSPHA